MTMAERIKIHTEIEEANQAHTADFLRSAGHKKETIEVLKIIASLDDHAQEIAFRAIAVFIHGPEEARQILEDSARKPHTIADMEEALHRAEALAI